MCRSECARLLTETSSTLAPETCSRVGADRWGPNRGGCCIGLGECAEPRALNDGLYCATSDAGHGSSCWSTISMCRNECVLQTTSTPAPETCCGVGVDRGNPNLGGCCSGLAECWEPRAHDDVSYCAAIDPQHGESCWSTIIMCRSECGRRLERTLYGGGLIENASWGVSVGLVVGLVAGALVVVGTVRLRHKWQQPQATILHKIHVLV